MINLEGATVFYFILSEYFMDVVKVLSVTPLQNLRTADGAGIKLDVF